jgi:type II secretory pathway component PulJ
MRLQSSSNQSNRRSAGLSLLEMMIGITIASIAFAAMASFTIYTARSFSAVGNYNDLDRASRNTLDILTRDIRESRALTYYTTNQLVFTANDTNTNSFNYNKTAGTLTRTKGTDSTVLLTGCDALQFHISQRWPSNNFMFYPPASNALSQAKLVDVSWRCSRKILGQKFNTESVQTAKIVIRN